MLSRNLVYSDIPLPGRFADAFSRDTSGGPHSQELAA